MKRKSQAALEFLTTYAWAFLVILIMVGALAYFGVLRPSKLLPDRCNFGSEVSCEDFGITSGDSGAVNLRLKNSVGEAITVNSVTLTTEGASGNYCTAQPTVTNPWIAGDVIDLSGSGCNADNVGFVAGDKAKVLVKILYYATKSGSTYEHEVSGEIFTTVT